MSVQALILVATALAMVAFGASVSRGAAYGRLMPGAALKIALLFGGFALIAPIIGWAIGEAFYDLIEAYDHWIAFALLSAIGIKMIADSKSDSGSKTVGRMQIRLLVVLVSAIATNVDAAVFGIALPGLRVDITTAAATIGAATFIASYSGTHLGRVTSVAFGHKAEILGGMILIAIGTKILLEYTVLAKSAATAALALQSPIFS